MFENIIAFLSILDVMWCNVCLSLFSLVGRPFLPSIFPSFSNFKRSYFNGRLRKKPNFILSTKVKTENNNKNNNAYILIVVRFFFFFINMPFEEQITLVLFLVLTVLDILFSPRGFLFFFRLQFSTCSPSLITMGKGTFLFLCFAAC